LTNSDGVTVLDTESRRAVGREVLVSLFVTPVLGDAEVSVVTDFVHGKDLSRFGISGVPLRVLGNKDSERRAKKSATHKWRYSRRMMMVLVILVE
jgi:hypothetical protein